MALSNRLRLFYLLHLANPAADRLIYHAIYEQRIRDILEIGIGRGERALRMIEVAAQRAPLGEIRYVGIDLFEDRSVEDGTGLSLKAAHRLLRGTKARTQLVPGDPLVALSRTANTLGPVDLAVVSATVDADALAKAWFYMPRVLHARSIVFLEDPTGGDDATGFRRLGLREVEVLAARSAKCRRAA